MSEKSNVNRPRFSTSFGWARWHRVVYRGGIYRGEGSGPTAFSFTPLEYDLEPGASDPFVLFPEPASGEIEQHSLLDAFTMGEVVLMVNYAWYMLRRIVAREQMFVNRRSLSKVTPEAWGCMVERETNFILASIDSCDRFVATVRASETEFVKTMYRTGGMTEMESIEAPARVKNMSKYGDLMVEYEGSLVSLTYPCGEMVVLSTEKPKSNFV